MAIIRARLVKVHVIHLVVQVLIWWHSKILLLHRSLHHLLLHGRRRLNSHLLGWSLHGISTWVESRLPQSFYLHFKLLSTIKVLIGDSLSFLVLQLSELLPNRVQAINCIFDLLCEIKFFISHSNIFLLLQLFDLEGCLRVQASLTCAVR